MLNVAVKKNTVSIPRGEYTRLKKMDERFRSFFTYIEHLLDIREARKEIKEKKLVSQEVLLKKLGL